MSDATKEINNNAYSMETHTRAFGFDKMHLAIKLATPSTTCSNFENYFVFTNTNLQVYTLSIFYYF